MDKILRQVQHAKKLYSSFQEANEIIHFLQESDAPAPHIEHLINIREQLIDDYNELFLVIKLGSFIKGIDFAQFHLIDLTRNLQPI